MDDDNFDPIMAMYLLVAKRILAAARILHDNLAMQNAENAMLASLDLIGTHASMMEAIAEYLTQKALLESKGDDDEYHDDYLTDKYNDLLLEASNGDPLVMLGPAFDDQLRLLGDLYDH